MVMLVSIVKVLIAIMMDVVTRFLYFYWLAVTNSIQKENLTARNVLPKLITSWFEE